jgi:hypothetical protein
MFLFLYCPTKTHLSYQITWKHSQYTKINEQCDNLERPSYLECELQVSYFEDLVVYQKDIYFFKVIMPDFSCKLTSYNKNFTHNTAATISRDDIIHVSTCTPG